MGKWCLYTSSFILERIIIKVGCNQDRHKSSVEYIFRPNQVRSLILELFALEWRKCHTFEVKYLWSRSANLYHMLCVASLGLGKGSISFFCRLGKNAGFHDSRKPPLTYNGKMTSPPFLGYFFRTFLYLQVTRSCIKSQTRLNFGQIGPLTI